ncbi:uncharacterized protein Aud_010375 [Aspergillus udagawae]|uniref:Uncharacterized protein n=1 Tax=Aspergillus udagawae TaxID=91492 RepID=A0A8E0QYS1_9EURO|nr:uncharacterized protein Aud_010375 [Aspergillus udagawae]GIC93887.1 hypothetical protein Aud_010375 [Aspergillus udagawae]
MGTAGPDTEWREDILLPGTKINLRHPLRIHEDHNNRFVKLLSEMKKGRDGSGQAEVHDVGAPGGDSQGIVSFNECKAITRRKVVQGCHQLWECLDHVVAVCPPRYGMFLKNPGLLRVTLSQAVHPPHRLEQGVEVQWWF